MRLLAKHDALNTIGATGGSVAGDQGGTHLWVTLRGLELARHSGEKTSENKLFFDADD